VKLHTGIEYGFSRIAVEMYNTDCVRAGLHIIGDVGGVVLAPRFFPSDLYPFSVDLDENVPRPYGFLAHPIRGFGLPRLRLKLYTTQLVYQGTKIDIIPEWLINEACCWTCSSQAMLDINR